MIKGVHADLRNGLALSVRDSLDTRRRAVLKGVVVVFSGGLLSDSHHPDGCARWRMAEALGASCAVKMDVSCVTHVVSQQADLDCVRVALGHDSRQIHAVNPTWLLDCAARWCRQSEALYEWTSSRDTAASEEVRALRRRDNGRRTQRHIQTTSPASHHKRDFADRMFDGFVGDQR